MAAVLTLVATVEVVVAPEAAVAAADQQDTILPEVVVEAWAVQAV